MVRLSHCLFGQRLILRGDGDSEKDKDRVPILLSSDSTSSHVHEGKSSETELQIMSYVGTDGKQKYADEATSKRKEVADSGQMSKRRRVSTKKYAMEEVNEPPRALFKSPHTSRPKPLKDPSAEAHPKQSTKIRGQNTKDQLLQGTEDMIKSLGTLTAGKAPQLAEEIRQLEPMFKDREQNVDQSPKKAGKMQKHVHPQEQGMVRARFKRMRDGLLLTDVHKFREQSRRRGRTHAEMARRAKLNVQEHARNLRDVHDPIKALTQKQMVIEWNTEYQHHKKEMAKRRGEGPQQRSEPSPAPSVERHKLRGDASRLRIGEPAEQQPERRARGSSSERDDEPQVVHDGPVARQQGQGTSRHHAHDLFVNIARLQLDADRLQREADETRRRRQPLEQQALALQQTLDKDLPPETSHMQDSRRPSKSKGSDSSD